MIALIVYFVVRGLDNGQTTQTTASEVGFSVIASPSTPREWRDVITVRGEAQAIRKVIAKAETSGVVAKTPVDPGSFVKTGDLLCELSVDARIAQLNEAKAALKKAQLDFDAAKALSEEGFQSATGVAGAQAALDLSRASVERASIEYSKTKIKAPFDGVFDDRDVEVGDFIRVGDPCGTLIQQDPFLITGAVSERVVARISKGDRGIATLATGEIIEGVVRFVGTAADPETRTFRVELQADNADRVLRDGVTAEFDIFASNRTAHIVPRSAIVLDEDGVLGVKTLDPSNMVIFNPVTLLEDGDDGVWIDGLSDVVNIIIRGQNYVRAGETVGAELRQSEAS